MQMLGYDARLWCTELMPRTLGNFACRTGAGVKPGYGYPRGLADLENFDPRCGVIGPSAAAVAHAIGGWCMLNRRM